MSRKLLLMVIGILLVVALGIYFKLSLIIPQFNNSKNLISDVNLNTTPSEGENQDLERQYKNEVIKVLKPFFEREKWEDISTQLSNIRTPYQYRNLHLDLIIAFSFIENGRKEDNQDTIEQGIEKLEEIKTQYPWIYK